MKKCDTIFCGNAPRHAARQSKEAVRVSITEEKARLRRELRAKSRALPMEYRVPADEAIRRHVRESAQYAAAGTIFAYLGVGWEIDTRPLLEQILADGKRLCLPLCTGPHEMAICVVRSLDELEDGAYGIPEPSKKSLTIAPDQVDLALVPCVAADRSGRRLGQGGGYYDAFLKSYHGVSFLLCRESALLEAVPVENHDFQLPFLVTETKVFSFPSPQS